MTNAGLYPRRTPVSAVFFALLLTLGLALAPQTAQAATGEIEAVSNSTDILREPKVETGKKTTTYMAISLAFMAGGILLCYLLLDIQQLINTRHIDASLDKFIPGCCEIKPYRLINLRILFSLCCELD